MISSNLSNDYNFIFLFLTIVISAFIFRILVSRIGVQKENDSPTGSNSKLAINKPLLIISIYMCAICLLICLLSTKLGIFRIYTTGDPAAIVSSFYDSILTKDYDTAYAYLNNSSGLGLEPKSDTVSDNNSSSISDTSNNGENRVKDLLEKSYSYSLSGNAIINGLYASQNVSFTYLDVYQLEAAAEKHIEPILNEKIKTLPKNDLYTDDDHYQASLMNKIYNEALDIALKNVNDYYVTINYDVTLEYRNGHWYMNTNDDMIKGFLGGQRQ